MDNNINTMNIEQHKLKLNKKYNQAIVDKVLNTMWSKIFLCNFSKYEENDAKLD